MEKLFLSTVFENTKQRSWSYLANEITIYFLKATRQNLSNPDRNLSQMELYYLQQKYFGGKTLITKEEFEYFWKWFGLILRELRYQKHLFNFWTQGLLFGFLDRVGAEECLRNVNVGCSIFRFSESKGGSIAVGCKLPTGLKNLLITSNDIRGSNVADFLRDKTEIKYILQYTGNYNNYGFPEFIQKRKDEALNEFYSIKKTS